MADLVDLAQHARALADGIDLVLPAWVVGSVERVYEAWAGRPSPPEVVAGASAAGHQARVDVGGRTRELLEADIDEQRTTPLALLRGAVRYPTSVLMAAGVPAVRRDDYATAAFPDDRYGLTPASWADLDPDLVELGVAWGAAKAWVHQRRHAPS